MLQPGQKPLKARLIRELAPGRNPIPGPNPIPIPNPTRRPGPFPAPHPCLASDPPAVATLVRRLIAPGDRGESGLLRVARRFFLPFSFHGRGLIYEASTEDGGEKNLPSFFALFWSLEELRGRATNDEKGDLGRNWAKNARKFKRF